MADSATVSLGELIVPAKTVRAGSAQLPVLSMTMQSGLVDQASKFKKRVASQDLSQYKQVLRGQLVVGFPINEGVLSFQWLYDRAVVSPAYGIWNVRDGASIDRKYLERYLRSPVAIHFYESKLRGTTARRRSLPDDIFREMPVPFRSLREQRRIADMLDRADSLRTKRRAARNLLDSLRSALFNDLFGDPARNPSGWPIQPLSSLIRSDDRINYGVVQPGEFRSGGVPLIRAADLVGGNVRHDQIKLIDPAIEEKYKRSRIRGGELLVSCVGSIGEVAVTTKAEKDFNVARAVARVPVQDDISKEYIAAYLRSPFAQRYFTSELRTVAQATLNVKQLKELPVVVPPQATQAVFDSRMGSFHRLEMLSDEGTQNDDLLWVSLQDQVFRAAL